MRSVHVQRGDGRQRPLAATRGIEVVAVDLDRRLPTTTRPSTSSVVTSCACERDSTASRFTRNRAKSAGPSSTSVGSPWRSLRERHSVLWRLPANRCDGAGPSVLSAHVCTPRPYGQSGASSCGKASRHQTGCATCKLGELHRHHGRREERGPRQTAPVTQERGSDDHELPPCQLGSGGPLP